MDIPRSLRPIVLLVVLLVFMFWNSRRRMQKQKAEQEEKARQTVPGAEVLLQGGLYGTIVAYDPENLDQPALVEIAPGVEIKVHSQAILRVVDPAEGRHGGRVHRGRGDRGRVHRGRRRRSSASISDDHAPSDRAPHAAVERDAERQASPDGLTAARGTPASRES